jgi:hypothetical protein
MCYLNHQVAEVNFIRKEACPGLLCIGVCCSGEYIHNSVGKWKQTQKMCESNLGETYALLRFYHDSMDVIEVRNAFPGGNPFPVFWCNTFVC